MVTTAEGRDEICEKKKNGRGGGTQHSFDDALGTAGVCMRTWSDVRCGCSPCAVAAALVALAPCGIIFLLHPLYVMIVKIG